MGDPSTGCVITRLAFWAAPGWAMFELAGFVRGLAKVLVASRSSVAEKIVDGNTVRVQYD